MKTCPTCQESHDEDGPYCCAECAAHGEGKHLARVEDE